jgi:hypothetical protein
VSGETDTTQTEPTPTVPHAEATFERPAGSASMGGGDSGGAASAAQRPEAMVGAAFAGGLIAAMILKRLGN